jgi:hypothetical protein
MLRVLNSLKAKGAEGLLGGIRDFDAVGNDAFELQSQFAQHGHRTWLKYEARNDIVSMELTHLFGHLDLSKSGDRQGFLLEMFQQNIPSFRNSGACLGVKSDPPHYLVSLNATHHFVDRMSDFDIADVLSIVLFDLGSGITLVESCKG